MIIDILMSLTMYFVSVFQGFLHDFRNVDCSSTPIIALKIAALATFSIRLIMALVTVEYEDDFLYEYVADIIWK